MYQIPECFRQFISPDCDRKAFIQNYLNFAGLDAPVIQMEGKNHIYVKFPQSQYNPMFRVKTVIAHYDRVAGSPGANDNSAAVFSMLEWALRLSKISSFHNIRLIFTDGEELGEEGVSSQGAFPLAALFRKLGITEDVFVFDCMGRGEVPVFAETILPKGASRNFVNQFCALEARTQKLLMEASGGKWFTLPVNYSDNASFIANGIPAVAITMLPSSEISDAAIGKVEPETWKLLHTPEDNFESLTPVSFEITGAILNRLAALKTLV